MSVASALVAQTDDHRLESTPETVVFGYYSAESAPVLRMRSGETVEITTSMIASPEMLEDAGLPAADRRPCAPFEAMSWIADPVRTS
ncbi:MAG: hypothetical protein R2748_20920 [Bryobacterales bacterium]